MAAVEQKQPASNSEQPPLKSHTSDSAFSALSISMATSTDSDSVDAFALPAVKYSHGVSKDTTLPPAV